MAIFSLVFFKILSALLSVFIGYFSGKFAKVQRDSIASLLFYFVAPIVFFAIPTNTRLHLVDLTVLLVSFILCSLMSIGTYFLYSKLWQDEHRNILSLSASTGNGGYVILPIATVIFDDKTLSIYALSIIGMDLAAMSVGYYICTHNFSTKKEALKRVLKLPLLNAFFIGFILSMIGFRMPNFLHEFVSNMKGAFSILGMLMIGIAISEIKTLELDFKFIGAAFFSKFVVFPIVFGIFIGIDKYITHFFDPSYYNAYQLMSFAPLATSTIIVASIHKIHPEKMASAVVLSQFFILLYMPIMAMLFLSDIPNLQL